MVERIEEFNTCIQLFCEADVVKNKAILKELSYFMQIASKVAHNLQGNESLVKRMEKL
jgi:hypothetical protein